MLIVGNHHLFADAKCSLFDVIYWFIIFFAVVDVSESNKLATNL